MGALSVFCICNYYAICNNSNHCLVVAYYCESYIAAIWACTWILWENTMYCYGLAYQVCNRTLHTAFHILSVCSETLVLFTVCPVSRCCTTHRTLVVLYCTSKAQIWACQPLTAQPHPNGVTSTPPQSRLDNCCFLQSWSAHTKKAHNRTGWNWAECAK